MHVSLSLLSTGYAWKVTFGGQPESSPRMAQQWLDIWVKKSRSPPEAENRRENILGSRKWNWTGMPTSLGVNLGRVPMRNSPQNVTFEALAILESLVMFESLSCRPPKPLWVDFETLWLFGDVGSVADTSNQLTCKSSSPEDRQRSSIFWGNFGLFFWGCFQRLSTHALEYKQNKMTSRSHYLR